jgi:hypothetical protein
MQDDPSLVEDPEGFHEEELEEDIAEMDRPLGADGRTAASEQRGRTLDEALGQEQPERWRDPPREDRVLLDRDEPDEEPQLLGEEADGEGSMSAEEAAVHEVDDPPGAADDANDGYDEV